MATYDNIVEEKRKRPVSEIASLWRSVYRKSIHTLGKLAKVMDDIYLML